MIELTHDPLKPEQITARVRGHLNGAVVTFLGTTRSVFEGRKVIHLEYEAYQEMALQKLEEIRQEVKARWDIGNVTISHRLGTVEVEDISLVVAIASTHRKEAFNACQYVVDRVKEIVPIWKKEVFEGGYHWVACDDHGEIEAEESNSGKYR